MSDHPDTPHLRIVRGEPDDVEVAALAAAVVAITAAGRTAGEPAGRSRWSDRSSLVRAPLRPGPGAWRAST